MVDMGAVFRDAFIFLVFGTAWIGIQCGLKDLPHMVVGEKSPSMALYTAAQIS